MKRAPLAKLTLALLGFVAIIAISLGSRVLPASAHVATVTGTTSCVSATGWTVTWRVTNSEATNAMTINSPAGFTPNPILAGTISTLTLTYPVTQTSATMAIAVTWADGFSSGAEATVPQGPACTAPPTATPTNTPPPTATSTETPTSTVPAPTPTSTTAVPSTPAPTVTPIPTPVVSSGCENGMLVTRVNGVVTNAVATLACSLQPPAPSLPQIPIAPPAPPVQLPPVQQPPVQPPAAVPPPAAQPLISEVQGVRSEPTPVAEVQGVRSSAIAPPSSGDGGLLNNE